MADSTNTTVFVVAAAAVVVAILWSRRASAASSGGRPPSGGAGSMPSPAGLNYGDILSGAGDLFSGLSDFAGTIFSSDDDAGYIIPGQSPQVTEQTSFIGSSCSADFNCGFGERCAGGYCVPETAALPSSDEFAFV